MILVIFLAFLLPVAVYCLVLAYVNWRPHPTMISGAWDFAGVLFAASGFLLVGGPFALAGFNQRWRELWLHGNFFRSWRDLPTATNPYWVALWGLYFVAVVAVCVVVIKRRRRVTSIYNIDSAALEECLGRVLEGQKRPWWRSGNHFVIAASPLRPDGSTTGQIQGEMAFAVTPLPTQKRLPEEPGGTVLLEVEPFQALRHVTLRWPMEAGDVRTEVEQDLVKELNQVYTKDNPVGVWCISVAVGLGSLIIFDVLLAMLRMYRQSM